MPKSWISLPNKSEGYTGLVGETEKETEEGKLTAPDDRAEDSA